jgi:translation initiation factor 2 alpha subunit (eIF-2alpha)
MKITKQAKEAQLQQIFRMLLESKTQEEIAHELNIALKTVQRYTQELDQRYGAAQRQKTDDTLFLECNLFKNRMLTLYKILQDKASQLKTNGSETAKCCEVAANIAIDVLKMESEGIKSVKELGFYGKQLSQNRLFNSIQSSKYDGTQDLRDNNITESEQQQSAGTDRIPDPDNRKF